jgi:monothiol glutaredoxin
LRSKAHIHQSSTVHRLQALADADVRQGIKEYANWPTILQLYVGGEFVGGSDIMREMFESGERQQVLAQQPA